MRLTDITERQARFMRNFSSHAQEQWPDAVGIAYLFLDCQCMKAYPVNDQGTSVGPEVILEPVCERCEEDRGSLERVISNTFVWLKSYSEKFKQQLLKKVFGDVPILEEEAITNDTVH